CRLLHAEPGTGLLHRHRWVPGGTTGRVRVEGDHLLLGGPPDRPVLGGFAATPSASSSDLDLGPIAIDVTGVAQVVNRATGSVLAVDVDDGRILRRTRLGGLVAGADTVIDVAVDGPRVLALLGPTPTIVAWAGGAEPERIDAPWDRPGIEAPAPAVALDVGSRGRLVVLGTTGTGRPALWVSGRRRPLVLDLAGPPTDVAVDADGDVVVAGRPGHPMLRLGGPGGVLSVAGTLDGSGYAGNGIAASPDGRIVHWSADGPWIAFPVSQERVPAGTCVTFRLDGERPGVRWGRLFLDACLPEGSSVRVRTVTSDGDLDDLDESVGWVAPPGTDAEEVHPQDTPPQLPLRLRAELDRLRWTALARRGDRELPWSGPPRADELVTYEAGVLARPGRYLWVELELRGARRRSPRIEAIRVERPGHGLLDLLPRAWSRDETAASFAHRYLAPAEGVLHDLLARVEARHLLVDPRTTPRDALPWLASLVGLTLDERIPDERRRAIVAEAVWLFARRGTVPGLARLLELALGGPVLVIERFRLRGLGTVAVGEAADPASWAVVGAGFRVGGAVADPSDHDETGPSLPPDAFELSAHRFAVVVPGCLDDDATALLRDLLEVHRPAHTVVDVCTAAHGTRVGVGDHLGLTTLVGIGSAFEPLVVGRPFGVGSLVGEPGSGTRPGAARVGDERLGWGR
ncbi:MAG TPA: phage tail protein, partial [Acidimicrobiales bacterium]|nr:phage tail protein [Acidimicrobiales bacterium]